MLFRQIFDDHLAQYAYLVGCQRTGEALVIDPQRDVDRYVEVAEAEGLRLVSAAETHIHADFLSGCRELAERGLRVYLSAEGGEGWEYGWADGHGYDVQLLRDGDSFHVGAIRIGAVHTPGHTPEHLSFTVTDEGGGAGEPMGLASGDFVFVGDTGRPDLLESAAGVQGAMREGAADLYRSIQRFLEMPDWMQVWPGHGAGSACGKALGAVPESTVGYERRFSPAMEAAREGESRFVEWILDAQPEPPLYFGRMKVQNRDGPPLLGDLPRPEPLDAAAIGGLADRRDVAVVDTRLGPSAYMASHLPGALYAPLDRTFPTVTGSYLDPETPIHLVVDEAGLETAVRDLVRIGLDRVQGWFPPSALDEYLEGGGSAAAIEEIDLMEMEERRHEGDTLVLDVRRDAEYREGHVPDALNVAHTRLLDRLDEIPRDRTLLVHCRTGARSAVAAAVLARHGYDAVYVNGPIDRWLRRHGEAARGAATPR